MKQKDEKSNGIKEPISSTRKFPDSKPVISNGIKTKPKHRNKCDLGPDFVAPGEFFVLKFI